MSAYKSDCESSIESGVASDIESLIDVAVEALTEADVSQDTIARFESISDDVIERIGGLEDTCDELRSKVASQSHSDAKDRKRISKLETQLDKTADSTAEDHEPEPDSNEPATDSHEQTPLEQVVQLPESTAGSELSSNQQRARFVAQDIKEYASKAPAGYVIKSGEVSTVLRAGTDAKGHTETVTRVMSFLDELGADQAEIVSRRGVKRIVFDRELVERLERIAKSHCGDGPREKQPLML
jgi:hypothetical protein